MKFSQTVGWMQVDLTDYADQDDDFVEVKHVFRAICSSHTCLSKAKLDKKKGLAIVKTEEGVVKAVEKKADWCPDCKSALYWDKYAA